MSTFAALTFMGVAIELSGSFVVAFPAFAAAELLVPGLLVVLCREQDVATVGAWAPIKAAS